MANQPMAGKWPQPQRPNNDRSDGNQTGWLEWLDGVKAEQWQRPDGPNFGGPTGEIVHRALNRRPDRSDPTTAECWPNRTMINGGWTMVIAEQWPDRIAVVIGRTVANNGRVVAEQWMSGGGDWPNCSRQWPSAGGTTTMDRDGDAELRPTTRNEDDNKRWLGFGKRREGARGIRRNIQRKRDKERRYTMALKSLDSQTLGKQRSHNVKASIYNVCMISKTQIWPHFFLSIHSSACWSYPFYLLYSLTSLLAHSPVYSLAHITWIYNKTFASSSVNISKLNKMLPSWTSPGSIVYIPATFTICPNQRSFSSC